MQVKSFRLVTVFCEAILESLVITELDELGIVSYTVSDCRGRGTRGVRSGAWSLSSNIRIEVMCDEEVAERLASALTQKYDKDYGLLIVASNVDILN
jgi:nitrogen regulatory protein PII